MSVADKLAKKFGANLGESLGVRTQTTPTAATPTIATVSPDEGRTRQRETGLMDIERIVPDPQQPRKEFDADALSRLSESLKRNGQLLPIRVRWNQDLGKWIIISGERRYQAAKRAGLTMLACVFVDRPLTESELLQEQIIENMLREDLKPIEQANAYKTLMELQSWNGAQVADALNISKATVSRVLALLKLPEDIQHQVERGDIPATAAYELAKLPTQDAQRDMAQRIVSEDFTRQEAVQAVRQEVEQIERRETTRDPQQEFRRETPAKSQSARTEHLDTSGAGQGGQQKPAPLLVLQDAPETDDEPKVTPRPSRTKNKPGRPRNSPKETVYRVEGGKVIVSFTKKATDAKQWVTALQQALDQARQVLNDQAKAA